MDTGGSSAAAGSASIHRGVVEAYADSGTLSNSELYQLVSQRTGLGNEFDRRRPVGKSGQPRSTAKRAARWSQQSLKVAGLLEKCPGQRGMWRLTGKGQQQLRRMNPGPVMLAFHHRLGVAVWADWKSGLKALNETVSLLFTSPPYPLAPGHERSYGNPVRSEWVDFICSMVEAVLPKLDPRGHVCLQIGQDQFEPNSPARTILPERLVIALHDRLGLHKLDTVVWSNPSKPPSPTLWACRNRVQLCTGHELLLVFSPDPRASKADNRRILKPHTDQHLALIRRGGEKRGAVTYSDGAYSLKEGSFGNVTAGTIPKNVWTVGHVCAGQRRYRQAAKDLRLPLHGAVMPERLAEQAIRWLTEEGDLVVDPASGTGTTPAVCARNDRRFYAIDCMAEYLRGAASRFDSTEVWINPELDRIVGVTPDGELPLQHSPAMPQ